MLRAVRLVTGLTLTLAVGSCASRPDLPEAPQNFAAAQALAAGEGAAIAAEPAPAWVNSLGVEELTGLVREARVANPQLQAAEARAQAARYRARGVRGGLLPDLSVGVGRSRTETFIV